MCKIAKQFFKHTLHSLRSHTKSHLHHLCSPLANSFTALFLASFLVISELMSLALNFCPSSKVTSLTPCGKVQQHICWTSSKESHFIKSQTPSPRKPISNSWSMLPWKCPALPGANCARPSQPHHRLATQSCFLCHRCESHGTRKKTSKYDCGAESPTGWQALRVSSLLVDGAWIDPDMNWCGIVKISTTGGTDIVIEWRGMHWWVQYLMHGRNMGEMVSIKVIEALWGAINAFGER